MYTFSTILSWQQCINQFHNYSSLLLLLINPTLRQSFLYPSKGGIIVEDGITITKSITKSPFPRIVAQDRIIIGWVKAKVFAPLILTTAIVSLVQNVVQEIEACHLGTKYRFAHATPNEGVVGSSNRQRQHCPDPSYCCVPSFPGWMRVLIVRGRTEITEVRRRSEDGSWCGACKASVIRGDSICATGGKPRGYVSRMLIWLVGRLDIRGGGCQKHSFSAFREAGVFVIEFTKNYMMRTNILDPSLVQ